MPTAGCPAKPCPMAFAVLELGVSEWVAFIVGLVSQSKQEIKAEPFLHWRGARPETLVCRFAHLCLLLPHFYRGISSTQAIRFALPLFCSGTLAQAQLQIRLLEFFICILISSSSVLLRFRDLFASPCVKDPSKGSSNCRPITED